MTGIYGLNCLAQFINDRAALLNWVSRAKPSTMLVMDAHDLAQYLKLTYPAMTVIHRAYNPADNHWHEVLSPADWLNAHRQFAAGGVVLQVFNEPHGYTDLRPIAHWCAELLALAAAENIRLCLPNWGVGHPDSNRIIAGELDELFRAFHKYPQHILGNHEYAQFSTIEERPYRIARFLDSLNRIQVLGLNKPRIIVTESGRDVGGGDDGWRSVFTESQYAEFLYGLRDVYSAYGVDCCIFGYGAGADNRWQSYNVEGANTLLGKLVEFNGQSSGDEMYKLYKPNATYSLNLRNAPILADNVIGSVAPAERVQLIRVTGGFANVRKENGQVGYVSEQAGAVVIERL